ncbi:PEGA domain-containing protein [Candidatus Gottesmanbacteria bacterium]|nr:PEGA domain-containing protein [Candidatus Gottesmanbacteria bacterium]
MIFTKIRPLLIQFALVCTIFFAAAGLIAYGRGYRIDINKKSLTPTGLLVATSDPTGSELLVDNKLITATNATINLAPNWYAIKIIKEGYIPWEKQIRVQGEILARADATLFPSNPSLATITTTGVSHPSVSPDGTKLAFVVPNGTNASESARLDEKRAGIYVLDLVDKPLSLLNRDARRIVSNEILDWSNALLTWSPNAKQLLVTAGQTLFQLDPDKTNDTPRPIFNKDVLMSEWEELEKTKQKEKIGGLKESLLNVATASMNIISFSPDETKILYEASVSGTIPPIIKPSLIGSNPTKEDRVLVPKHLYVYDIKEDKNYPLGPTSAFTRTSNNQAFLTTKPRTNEPSFSVIPSGVEGSSKSFSSSYQLSWLPTSLHLVVATSKGIDIMEYDGTNRATVYAGPFLDGFVTPWATGMKLVILTNLNPTASSLPNLYSVNLR